MNKKQNRDRIRKYIFGCLVFIITVGLCACSQPMMNSYNPSDVSDDQFALDRLKVMSNTLSAADQFQIQTRETHEWVDADGKNNFLEGISTTDVIRPGKMKLSIKASGDHDLDYNLYFYDATLSYEGHKNKVWCIVDTQETIDEMLDEVAWRFDLPIPVSDFLYTSAYDSLITDDTRGLWTERVKIGDKFYDHFFFSATDIEWEIWLNTDETALPYQMKIFKKGIESSSKSTIIFTSINLNYEADPSDFIFTPKDDYTQITVTENPNPDDETTSSQGGE